MKSNETKKRRSIREYKAAAWAVTKAQFPSVWQIFLCFVLIGLPFSYASLISQVPLWDKSVMTFIEFVVLCVHKTFLTGVLSIGGMVAVMRMILARPVSLRTLFVGFRQRYGKIVWLNLSS
ncbi:MAG: hypothetical protein IJC52_04480, partial [Clostridia bacterium]|nr:hypothetical protein [Clostridia bacterium]